ncbi:MAG TPA: Rieske 2Fe-2S domain-containing protein [Terriglobales bacterium]|jgi:phenylpropionate dioxygenase-like ring-hydroxylating dioxygenase large terminal subunit
MTGEVTRAAVGSSGPTTTLIYDDWYPAIRASEIASKKMAKAIQLGIPLVLGRKSDGKYFAMRDLCPHRGIPLSYGWFDGQQVTCKYHGWGFEPVSGQCREIPSLTKNDTLDPCKIFATAYPCEERDGHLWVYVPQGGRGRVTARPSAKEALERGTPGSTDLPPVPEVPKFGSRFHSAHLVADLPCNIDHGIIGLMDPAHGPFVHQSWWWRSQASIHEKEKHFEPIDQGFRMTAHQPSANSAPYKLLGVYGEKISTTIDFVLPNRRYEIIRAGEKWFSSLTTVTPTTGNNCRIDVCAAWNVFLNVPFLTSIAKFFGNRFVRQDQETMIQQAEGLKYNPSLMLIDDADRPAKWYFELKQARLESQASGQPMRHPMDGPVTLHWRS